MQSFNKRSLRAWGSYFAFSLLFLGLGHTAVHAVVVSANFSGPEQLATTTITLSAQYSVQGSGVLAVPFQFNPNPQSGLVSASPTTNAFHPATTVPNYTKLTIVNNQLVNITNLLLGYKNSQPLVFPGPTMQLTTIYDFDDPPDGVYEIPGSIALETSAQFTTASVSSLNDGVFQSTGPGTGTFQMTAQLSSNLYYAFTLGGAPLGTSSYSGSSSQQMHGTYQLSGPPSATKLVLEGTVSYVQTPIAHTAIATDVGIVAVTGTFDLLATQYITATFHLEQIVAIPEPGSVVLLGLGIAGLALLALPRGGRGRTR